MVDVVSGFDNEAGDHANDKDASGIQGPLANMTCVTKLDNDDLRIGGRVQSKVFNA